MNIAPLKSRSLLRDILRNATAIQHSRSTLANHLLETCRILSHWRAPSHVTTAGLIHSIYATQYFLHSVIQIDGRRQVQDSFGESVEELVFLFCTIDRHWLWQKLTLNQIPSSIFAPCHTNGSFIEIKKNTIKNLALLEVANAVEQASTHNHMPQIWMSWALKCIKLIGECQLVSGANLPQHLDEESELVAQQIYVAIVTGKDSNEDAVNELCYLNPFAAESHILKAWKLQEQNRITESTKELDQAEECLNMWGCTWDRRVSYQQLRHIIYAMKHLLKQLNTPQQINSSIGFRELLINGGILIEMVI